MFQGYYDLASNMITQNRNMNIIDIMEVTGLTEDELLRLQNEKVTVQLSARQ